MGKSTRAVQGRRDKIFSMQATDNSQKILTAALFTAFFLISLFDFYDFNRGAPIYSIAGTVLFFVVSLVACRLPEYSEIKAAKIWPICLTILLLLTALSTFSVLLRGVSLQMKTPTGFFIGQLAFGLTILASQKKIYSLSLMKVLDLLIAAHLFCFFLQVIYFIFTGSYLDWVEMVVGEPSRYNPGGIIPWPRFTGLFVEPAHCAGFLFLLCTARLVRNGFNNDRIVSALILAMVLTISVLGFFSLFALVLAIIIRDRRWTALWALLFVLGVASIIVWSDPDIHDYLIARISSPLEDKSGQARLVNGLLDFISLDAGYLYFGYGLGNPHLLNSTYEVLSGYVYILFYFGCCGALVFFASILAPLVSAQGASIIIGFVIITLLGKPPFTTPFWWLWLAYLVIFCRQSTTQARRLNR